jgi:hypothetical protein
MTLEQVQAAAPAPIDIKRFSDEIASEFVFVEFWDDGWNHNVHLDGHDAVDHLWATRPLESFQHTLELLEELVTQHGPPSHVRKHDDEEKYEWEWTAEQHTTVVVTREGDGWFVRIDRHRERFPSPFPPIDMAVAREIVAAVGVHLGNVTIGDGPRGAAVARWRDDIAARRDRLEQFLDVVAIVTSQAPIFRAGIMELLEQASWLAQHDQLFAEPEDWCNALVVHHEYHFNRNHLGWRVTSANERDRYVFFLEGPFAAGIVRVFRAVDELYPIRDDVSLEGVEVTVREPTYREDGFEKMKPHLARAWFRGTHVDVSGGPDLDRIARLLVFARASKRD